MKIENCKLKIFYFGMSASKIFLWCLLLAFIGGVSAASFLFIPIFVYIFIFLTILCLWLIIRPNKKILIVALAMIFFILGYWRYQISFPRANANNISFHNNQEIIFQGQIIQKPDEKIDKTNLTIGRIKIDRQSLVGTVLITVPLYSNYQYGDVLEIKCKLQEPGVWKDFNYHEYLARYDIYSVCFRPKIQVLKTGQGNFFYNKIIVFKNTIQNLINQNFTEPQGSIFSALLLGIKRQIPLKVRNWFSRAGLAHVLAVSGLHIAILFGLINDFLVKGLMLRRQMAFWLLIVIMVFFVILVGAPVSAVRAAIMMAALLYGEKIGRPQNGIRVLILAASLMLLANPKLLKSDIGWQLSFSSILGIALLKNYFQGLFKKIPNFTHRFPARDMLSITCSAYLFTLPLILYYFGNLSLSAPLANILVLPILPLLMILGFLFMIFGGIWPVLAMILKWPIWILLTYMIGITKFLAALPGFSFIFGRVSFWLVAALYFLIIMFIIKIKKTTNVIII